MMTKQEAIEFLKNKKVFVRTESVSKEIQEKLFKLGWKWACEDEEDGCIVQHENSPFLYIEKNMFLTQGCSGTTFVECTNEVIEPGRILGLEWEEFDCNFKPFDKVLVRDEECTVWIPEFFLQYERDSIYPYRTMSRGLCYKQCIPYKGNEHLALTSNRE